MIWTKRGRGGRNKRGMGRPLRFTPVTPPTPERVDELPTRVDVRAGNGYRGIRLHRTLSVTLLAVSVLCGNPAMATVVSWSTAM